MDPTPSQTTNTVPTATQIHHSPTKIIVYILIFLVYTAVVSLVSAGLHRNPSVTQTNTPSSGQANVTPTPDLQLQVMAEDLAAAKGSFTENVLTKNATIKSQFENLNIDKIVWDGSSIPSFYVVSVTDSTNSAKDKIYAVTADYSKVINDTNTLAVSQLMDAKIFNNRAVVDTASGEGLDSFILLDRTTGNIIKFSDPKKLLSTDPSFSSLASIDGTGLFFQVSEAIQYSVFGGKIYFFQNTADLVTAYPRHYFTYIFDATTGELVSVEPYTLNK